MKPIHAKPSLYAYYFEGMKSIALQFGYNLVVHGSMNRDLDIIAIAWVDKPDEPFNLIKALSDYINGFSSGFPVQFLENNLPGGRKNYVINLYRGGYRKDNNGDILDPIEFIEDPQYYIDISFTPLP